METISTGEYSYPVLKANSTQLSNTLPCYTSLTSICLLAYFNMISSIHTTYHLKLSLLTHRTLSTQNRLHQSPQFDINPALKIQFNPVPQMNYQILVYIPSPAHLLACLLACLPQHPSRPYHKPRLLRPNQSY